MAEYQIGSLSIDPARNPAVLDTATWDPAAARERLQAASLEPVPGDRVPPAGVAQPVAPGVDLLPGSSGRHAGAEWVLARLEDGQQVLLAYGRPAEVPCPALYEAEGLAAFPASSEVVEWLLRHVHPERGPRALGAVPRLGIGTRMSTAVWPGVWPALERQGIAANAIQNSVRELNLLEDLVAGRPARGNYMFGFGTLFEGHTGSTFEGLWLAGVLSALAHGYRGAYGADADHIMVKRGPDGLQRARRVLAAARRYTFFTLDVSDVLDYAAMDPKRPAALAAAIPEESERHDVLAFHSGRLSHEAIARAAAKHWSGLAAAEELAATLGNLKRDTPFDLELSIDETPAGIRALDCLTTEDEMAFILGEVRRRGLPITHVAPNLGVEKGKDYLGTDGLPGLEARTRALHRLTEEAAVQLDCHSGDDLSPATRQAIGRATGGRIHFKISPMLQEIFAEVLHALYPERFLFWWEDAAAYAVREAEAGSSLAAHCLRDYADGGSREGPSPAHCLFHYYGFATVGRRDDAGRFVHRERFYELPADFCAEYARRVEALLLQVAEDVLSG